jgi:hypothetical protein
MDRPDSPLLGFTDCPPSPDPLAHPSPTFTRFLPDHLPTRNTLSPLPSSRHNPHSHSLPAPPRQPMTPFLYRSPSSTLRTPRRSSSRSSTPRSASSRHAVYIPDSIAPTPVWLSAPSPSREKPGDLDDYTFPARVDSPAHHLELELPVLDDIKDLFTLPTSSFKSISAPASAATSRSVSRSDTRSHSARQSTFLLPDRVPPSPTTPTASTVSLLTISTPDTSPHAPRLRDDDDSSVEALPDYPCVSRWSLSTCSQGQATPLGGGFQSSYPIRGFRRHTVEKERGRDKERAEKPKSPKRKTLASFIARLSGAPMGWASILNPRPDIEPALFSGPGPSSADLEPPVESPQTTYEFPTISVGHSRPTTPATAPLWLGRNLKSDSRSMCSVAAPPEEVRSRASTLSGVNTGLGGLSRGIGNRSSSALSLITFGGGIGKKKMLIVTGLKRDDKRGYEAVRAWCEVGTFPSTQFLCLTLNCRDSGKSGAFLRKQTGISALNFESRA